MTTFNCFSECMRCNNHSQSEEHPFKMKKDRKFITLTKNVPKASLNPHMITFSSIMTAPSKVQEIQLQSHVKAVRTPSKIRQYSSLQYKDNSHGKRRVKIQNVENRHPRVVFVQSHRQTRSIDERQRRYSIDKTPKPTFSHQHFMSMPNAIKKHEFKLPRPQNNSIVSKVEELISRPLYQMKEIREVSQQKEKCSSLFQGARSIVSRMATSRKNDEVFNTLRKQNDAINTSKKEDSKSEKKDMQVFYDSARLCETQDVIVLTHSSLAEEEEEKRVKAKFNQISLEQIPMSPRTKHKGHYPDLNVGRLIGVGKWAHVYLCQQKQTNSIYVIKEIFKEILKIACSVQRFSKTVNELSVLNHSNLMGVYGKFQTADKLCVILQYCHRCLFDEIREKGIMPISKVRNFSSNLIKAVVFLHQNQIIHGNVNIFQAFDSFGECKLKHSLTRNVFTDKWPLNTFKADIEGLAITIFEMAHGLIPLSINTDTLYQKEKLYHQNHSRLNILEYVKKRVQLSETDSNYRNLNSLIKMLLDWDEQFRLTGSLCLDHLFFQEGKEI